MSVFADLTSSLTKLARTAIWGWLSTLLIVSGTGLVVSAGTWWWFGAHSPWNWVIAGLTVVEFAVAGWMLAGKQGLTAALIQGVQSLGLGRAVVSRILNGVEQRMTTSSSDATGAQQSTTSSFLDRRWSIEELQSQLQLSVNAVAGERMKGVTGWLLGRVQSRLISAAQSMIRSRVKAPEVGQTHTQGITFRELRAGLESNADQVLASRFRTVASRSTWFVMAVLCLVLITQWGLACWLLSSKSTSNVTSISDMHGFIRGEL